MQRAISLSQFLNFPKTKSVSAKQEIQENNPIFHQISDVLYELEVNKSKFELETESDMIDALIFEEKALMAKYRYLLSLAKEQHLICTPATNYKIKFKN